MMRDVAGALLVGGYDDRGSGGLTRQTPSDAPMRPCYGRGACRVGGGSVRSLP